MSRLQEWSRDLLTGFSIGFGASLGIAFCLLVLALASEALGFLEAGTEPLPPYADRHGWTDQ